MELITEVNQAISDSLVAEELCYNWKLKDDWKDYDVIIRDIRSSFRAGACFPLTACVMDILYFSQNTYVWLR